MSIPNNEYLSVVNNDICSLIVDKPCKENVNGNEEESKDSKESNDKNIDFVVFDKFGKKCDKSGEIIDTKFETKINPKSKDDNGYAICGNGVKSVVEQKSLLKMDVKGSINLVGGLRKEENKGENDNTTDLDELVNGWLKWDIDNIPRDVFVELLSKSVGSSVKLLVKGHGIYGSVYKAQDWDIKKIIALKKVHWDTSMPQKLKFDI